MFFYKIKDKKVFKNKSFFEEKLNRFIIRCKRSLCSMKFGERMGKMIYDLVLDRCQYILCLYWVECSIWGSGYV